MRLVVLTCLLLAVSFSHAQSSMAENDKALALIEAEKYDEALAILNKLIAAEPGMTLFRQNKAVALFALERYWEAIVEYKRLHAELPEVEWLFQIANSYEQMDSLNRALTYYSAAIREDGEDYLSFFKRGTVYLKQKKFAGAIADFTEAIALNPEHHNSYHNRGIAQYQIKKYQEACADWCTAEAKGNPVSGEHVKVNCKNIAAACK
jgi:tetratricopeptide (TPR) repeat protein